MAQQRRRRPGLTRVRPGSPNRYCNFTVNGRRFRHSLGTDDRDTAEILAAKLHSDALLGKLVGKAPELSLTMALGRYWLEHAQHLASRDDIKRMGKVLERELGGDTLLSEITTDDLALYVMRRRAGLSNRSVNAELEHLRAVMRRAGDVWEVDTARLRWRDLLLEEAGGREHELSAEEEARLFAALRPDYHALVRFTLLCGMRRANVIGLRWDQVDFAAGAIRLRVKSKKPGGELKLVPLTAGMRAILGTERGRHPVYVFTYVAERTSHDRHAGRRREAGRRYHFTLDGWRKEWRRALTAAEIADFRFHDLRHTAATRKLRNSRNLIGVQKMLGHSRIETTARYTHVLLEDVRAMMEAEELAQSGPTDLPPAAKTGGGSVA